jgi:hypothetical protein
MEGVKDRGRLEKSLRYLGWDYAAGKATRAECCLRAFGLRCVRVSQLPPVGNREATGDTKPLGPREGD